MSLPVAYAPRPARVSFARFHGLKLLAFERWQRANYELPARDDAQASLRYKRYLLTFS